MTLLVFIAVFSFIIILLIVKKNRTIKASTSKTLAPNLKEILHQKVVFYQKLGDSEKIRFETAVNDFINRVTIEWVGMENNSDIDRVLVAASAIIPIFGFGDWHYPNLTNVILYPNTFNKEYQFENGQRNILGMVGGGYMNGQMILSQKSLREDFSDPNSKNKTGIHEFVHLLDKSDGATDGIPSLLLEKAYILPWINLIHLEMSKISMGDSDINPYGATNESEFLAVVSEYFFSQPQKMQVKHPELYALLEKVFQQTPSV